MALSCNCDFILENGKTCDKKISLIPKEEFVLDEKGHTVLEEVSIQQADGSLAKVSVPKKRYLEEKANLIYLKIGDWFLQVELCDEHFNGNNPFMNKLKDIATDMKKMRGL